MKIETVSEPMYCITISEKERQVLEDIFGNMTDVYLNKMLGNTKHSEFVLEFYNLLAYQK